MDYFTGKLFPGRYFPNSYFGETTTAPAEGGYDYFQDGYFPFGYFPAAYFGQPGAPASGDVNGSCTAVLATPVCTADGTVWVQATGNVVTGVDCSGDGLVVVNGDCVALVGGVISTANGVVGTEVAPVVLPPANNGGAAGSPGRKPYTPNRGRRGPTTRVYKDDELKPKKRPKRLPAIEAECTAILVGPTTVSRTLMPNQAESAVNLGGVNTISAGLAVVQAEGEDRFWRVGCQSTGETTVSAFSWSELGLNCDATGTVRVPQAKPVPKVAKITPEKPIAAVKPIRPIKKVA